jgi:hypothetical protein
MRYPDWPDRLNQYIAEHQGKLFRLGVFDCCKFTLGAVEAMTGMDYLPEYSGPREAVALLEEKPLDERLAEVFKPVHPAMAQQGDIGYFEEACGIVLGRHTLFVGDPWRLIATTQLEAAYRV